MKGIEAEASVHVLICKAQIPFASTGKRSESTLPTQIISIRCYGQGGIRMIE